jgi:beta-N-acetylhexosaminidase
MRHFSTKILVFSLLVIALLSGYNYFKRPFLNRFAQFEAGLESQLPPTVVDPVQDAFDKLSAREKVLQMVSFPLVADSPEASVAAEVDWLAANRAGFVTLFGSALTVSEATELIDATRFPDGYAPLVAVDHEGGTVQRLSGTGFTRLPSWRSACQLTTTERSELFTTSAAELAKVGVQIVFAPVVDVARSGSFLGARACTSEDEIVAASTDYINSFARFGILPVLKHFPGIGSASSDLHFQLDTVSLEPADTLVFDRLLEVFPNIGVMSTHVVVTDVTAGTPCSLNATCLERFPLNFPEVLLFTDALEMRSASLTDGSTEVKSLPAVAIQAAAAGNNVLVFGEKVGITQIEEVVDALESRYESNENFRRQIDASVKKILSLKLPQAEEAQ